MHKIAILMCDNKHFIIIRLKETYLDTNYWVKRNNKKIIIIL